MDIQARKIEFVQEFLKLQSEEVISNLEKFLMLEKKSSLKPMSIEELNSRIDKSEADFNNGNYKSSAELLKKYL